jgi:hypothetical protein
MDGAQKCRRVVEPLRRFDCSHGELKVLAIVYEAILNSQLARSECVEVDSPKPSKIIGRSQRRQTS